ncbi:NADP-dependent 3-hydroxy acid dehydrogenase YdfG [Novosphingobium kunmingense]|uniref:NADP-dependent 3-hydroxy acid dehydrogenase YdfG n=1 Tax=Novosphingobium kunmingense TaxID=1211806 RepID=A0A2N0H397_9SPHN|nr:SDR family NAD(P)-dependent oxidoreductase [Novosphingobium kunmingense]PKB13415.1 NADP-dependent 3-hydroxy acid dehydrogenase YdfG [Novosphingobium kunmingense]
MTQIHDKTAFVTGGASGLGLAMATALAKEGARVILADCDRAGAERAAAALRNAGVDAIGLELDVTDEAAWARAGEEARAFGPVRLLVSNAGVGGGAGSFETYDTEVWRWNYAVNAHAHLYACRTFLGEMKASGEASHLLLTSSMVAIVPPPISVAYISSKYATLGIAMALRNELAETCVGLSVLMPGMTATRIVETTRNLRPGESEQGGAAATSQAMQGVLAGGMPPEKSAAMVVEAIRDDRFWIFTHPEWKRMAELVTADMLAGFGASADPDYRGDDIDALIAANGGRMFGAQAARG